MPVAPILLQAWSLFRKNFELIAAVVLAVWAPVRLLSGIFEYFTPEGSGLGTFAKVVSFLCYFFVWIVASTVVTSVGNSAYLGRRPSFRDAFQVGSGLWGRMIVAQALRMLFAMVGFVLLVVPGIWLMLRLALVDAVVVCEGVSGWGAIRRSFQMTRGRGGRIFCLFVVNGFLSACIGFVVAFGFSLNMFCNYSAYTAQIA